VKRARPGVVAGTSLAYRTVSDQKVNSTQCSGEDWATIHQRAKIRVRLPNFLSCSGGEPAPASLKVKGGAKWSADFIWKASSSASCRLAPPEALFMAHELVIL